MPYWLKKQTLIFDIPQWLDWSSIQPAVFFQELSYPEIIEVGVVISKLGNSSMQYDLAIFKPFHDVASAQGHFVHVFVDRQTRKSTPIPIEMRDALSQYCVNE